MRGGARRGAAAARRRGRDLAASGTACSRSTSSERPLTPRPRLAGHAARRRRRSELRGGSTRPPCTRAPGCFLHPSFWPAKLAWLREERPTLRPARRFVSASRTTCYAAADAASSARRLSIASGTGLLDLARAGLGRRAARRARGRTSDCCRRSRTSPDGDEPGTRRSATAPARTSAPAASSTRRAALMVGTSGALRILYEAEPRSRGPGLFLYRLDERRVVEGGAFSDGGNLYAWLEQDASRRPRLDSPTASRTRTASRSCRCSAASAVPGWNRTRRGAIAGLTFDTTPSDLPPGRRSRASPLGSRTSPTSCPRSRRSSRPAHALLGEPRVDRRWSPTRSRGPSPRPASRRPPLRGAAVLALRAARDRAGARRRSARCSSRDRSGRPDLRGLRERQRELYRAPASSALDGRRRRASAPPRRCASASIPAAASSSAGLPEPRHLAHREPHDAAGVSPSESASSTASPSPPSGQWSSTVTIRPPVASAAARSVSRVDRLDRVEVDHARLDPLAGERVGRLQRLVQRDPGGRRSRRRRPRASDRASRRSGTPRPAP